MTPASSTTNRVASLAALTLLCALAAVACASEPPMSDATTPAAPAAPAADSSLLVEVRKYSRFTGGSGYRVMADGRYETYHQERPGEPNWKAGTPLSTEAIARVRAALDAIDPATLEPRYDSGKAPRDRGDTLWKVRVGGKVVQVEVVPGTEVPELDSVRTAVTSAVGGEVSMEWIVGPGDEAPRYAIRPDADIAALDGVINTLIGAGEPCTARAPTAGATRILAVVWKSEGGDERQELWSDGLEIWPAGEDTSCKRHPPEIVAMVQSRLAAVDWTGLAIP